MKTYMRINREWFEGFLDWADKREKYFLKRENHKDAETFDIVKTVLGKIARHSSEISCKEFNNENG